MIITALPRCERAAIRYLTPKAVHLMMPPWMQISHRETFLWEEAEMITVVFCRHRLSRHEGQCRIVKTLALGARLLVDPGAV